MSNIEILSRRIDGEISSVRTALGMGMYPVARNCLQGVGSLIDEYRAEVAKEIEGLKRDVKSAEGWRDEWKLDAATSEAKLEKAIDERDAYKVQRDGAEIALSKIRKLAEHPDDVVDAEYDPGAPEGDKTVISFECCGVKHTFSPPKLGNWRHEAECQECGSLTTFTSAN